MARMGNLLTRRDLLKRFGLSALLIHPVLRSMAYAAPTDFETAPRFMLFFKGGSFYPARTNPRSLSDLGGTPIVPLAPHASDLILFKGMNIHGGKAKCETDAGYQDEHAAGVIGGTTGNAYKFFKRDTFFTYTDHESIDVRIANHYKSRPDLKNVPLTSLHIGAGAHSDSDNVGPGQRFISFRNRLPEDSRYGNAIEPLQDAGAVFDLLMRTAAAQCSAHSRRPLTDRADINRALERRSNVADFLVADIKDAQRRFGMDTEHARKLDALLENWIDIQKSSQRAPVERAASGGRPCPAGSRPTGNGANKFNLDVLSPVHDQMIDLVKFAFEMDLTRVVAFTLSGGSCGQTWPSRGLHKAHHTMEHNGDIDGLVKMDTYYAEKFSRLLNALKSVDDGGGRSALFNSAVVLGMECWSNSAQGHYVSNIPFISAGQAGGRFETGRIVNAGGRNNNDLFVSIQKAAGIESDTFGLPSLCHGPII